MSRLRTKLLAVANEEFLGCCLPLGFLPLLATVVGTSKLPAAFFAALEDDFSVPVAAVAIVVVARVDLVRLVLGGDCAGTAEVDASGSG